MGTRKTSEIQEIHERFVGGPSAHWAQTPMGAGCLRLSDAGALRLELPDEAGNRYSNAQLDDYSGRRASAYLWRPPLRLHVRVHASHAAHGSAAAGGEAQRSQEQGAWLRGTVGFGFWNAPFTLAGGGLRAPDALWFFGASPPSRMALTVGGSGCGWKAQVVHAHRAEALLAAPPLALTALWARVSGDERPAARWMQRLTGAQEAALDPDAADLRQWHDYTLEWRPESARFLVDGREALCALEPPRGPLGFVAWIDNQYAIATPRGELRFGALAHPAQWLELAAITIEPLA